MDIDRVKGPTFMQWFRGNTVTIQDYIELDRSRSYWTTEGQLAKSELQRCLDREVHGNRMKKEAEDALEKTRRELAIANARVVSLSRVVEDLKKRGPEQESRTRSRIEAIREVLTCIKSDMYDHWNFQDVEAAQCSDGN